MNQPSDFSSKDNSWENDGDGDDDYGFWLEAYS